MEQGGSIVSILMWYEGVSRKYIFLFEGSYCRVLNSGSRVWLACVRLKLGLVFDPVLVFFSVTLRG